MASLHQDKVSRECLSESRSTFALAGVEPSRGDEAARGGDDMDREEGVSPPPSKRPHPSEELRTESRGEVHGITGLTLPQGVNLPGTNIKITSRGEGEGSSLFVSMELNGLTYQGILFQKGPSAS